MQISTREMIEYISLKGMAVVIEEFHKKHKGMLANDDSKPSWLDLTSFVSDYLRVYPLLKLALENRYDRRDTGTKQETGDDSLS